MKAWLTNGAVAWEVPRGRVARFYLAGAYLPPEDWQVQRGELPREWTPGDCGEMRRSGLERYGSAPARLGAGERL